MNPIPYFQLSFLLSERNYSESISSQSLLLQLMSNHERWVKERNSHFSITLLRQSNRTVQAYIEHQKVLEAATKIEVLSLFHVCKLAASLTDFHPTKVDMCPKSCIAYTGP